ncbi:MAG: four helix bundle protein [Prevotellaceae bacterium]|nr:four helix bundle protein [Candidatus Colivivens equi]
MTPRQIEFQDKCVAFAVEVVNLEKILTQQKKEYSMSDQLKRCSTSIGANYSEAVYAESDIDFVHKMGIAQKETNETLYWLKVLYKTNYIDNETYNALYGEANELMKVITSSIISVKKRLKQIS